MTPNEKIKAYRQIKGWSQTEAARIWGISQSILSAIERGERNVGPTVAYRIQKNTKGDLKNLWEPKPQ